MKSALLSSFPSSASIRSCCLRRHSNWKPWRVRSGGWLGGWVVAVCVRACACALSGGCHGYSSGVTVSLWHHGWQPAVPPPCTCQPPPPPFYQILLLSTPSLFFCFFLLLFVSLFTTFSRSLKACKASETGLACGDGGQKNPVTPATLVVVHRFPSFPLCLCSFSSFHLFLHPGWWGWWGYKLEVPAGCCSGCSYSITVWQGGEGGGPTRHPNNSPPPPLTHIRTLFSSSSSSSSTTIQTAGSYSTSAAGVSVFK